MNFWGGQDESEECGGGKLTGYGGKGGGDLGISGNSKPEFRELKRGKIEKKRKGSKFRGFCWLSIDPLGRGDMGGEAEDQHKSASGSKERQKGGRGGWS